MPAPLFYQVIHKPTFTRQLLALPRKDAELVIAKIEHLSYHPEPDGKNKKRLTHFKGNVFRIRAGDYRILYRFNSNVGWVQLLGVDDRADVYGDDGIATKDDHPDLRGLPEGDNAPESVAPEPRRQSRPTSDEDDGHDDTSALPLPVPLTPALLDRLRIAPEHHPALLACQTIDDLIAAPVPEPVRELAFDAIIVPDYDTVLDEPNLLADSPDDFRRFYEGSLTQFMLQLDPEQQRFVEWALDGSGPMLLKGGPGTGKSLVALYRVRSLIAALRRAGVARPRILVTSFTNSLVEASRQLLAALLGPDQELVTVTTVDKLVWELLAAAGASPKKLLGDAGQARGPVVQARQRLHCGTPEDRLAAEAIASLGLDFLLGEIDEVIVAREHRTLEGYLAANRGGRGVRLTASQRRAIWRLHEEREAIAASSDALTFSQQRLRALEVVRAGGGPPPFDGVIVDEAQDLEPTAIRLLVALCKESDRLFLTADPNQSIYGGGVRWVDVHEDLQFRGRTGVLRKNYRSTRQIMEAAEWFLAWGGLEDEGGLPECPREGPRPRVCHTDAAAAELGVIAAFLREATRELRVGVGACAVLVPGRQAGFAMVQRLAARGLVAKYMERQGIELDLPTIKVMTRHTAKGLEFPIVAVTALPSPSAGAKPPPGGAADEQEDARQMERRTLYVAMTRAMERLLVVAPPGHPLLGAGAFDPTWWQEVAVP